MADYNVQVNATVGGVLININGETVNEVIQRYAELAKRAPEFLASLQELSQGQMAAEVITARSSTATPDVPTNVSQAPPAAGSVVSCPHGPMKDCAGMRTQAGAPYKFRYYCTEQGPNKCKSGRN